MKKIITPLICLVLIIAACGDNQTQELNTSEEKNSSPLQSEKFDTSGVLFIDKFDVKLLSGRKIIGLSSYEIITNIFGRSNVGNLSGRDEGGTAIGLINTNDKKLNDAIRDAGGDNSQLVANVEYLNTINFKNDEYLVVLYHWCKPLEIEERDDFKFWCNDLSSSSELLYSELYGAAVFKKISNRYYLFGNNICFRAGREELELPQIIQIGKNKIALSFESRNWGGTGGNVSLAVNLIFLDRAMNKFDFETSYQEYDQISSRTFSICESDKDVFDIKMIDNQTDETTIYTFNQKEGKYNEMIIKKINEPMLKFDGSFYLTDGWYD